MGNVTKTTTSPTEKPAPYQEGQHSPIYKEQENEFLAVLDDYPSPDISQPVFSLGEKLRVISKWLFDGVGREKAEELLQLPDTKTGSYMIRQSENKKGLYSLSVRHRQVKHYRIFRLPNNWYYISPRLTFQCLEHLVDHYSETADGLCCVLTTPCLTQCTVNRETQPLEAPVVMRRNQFNWRDTKRLHLNHEGTRTSSENDDSLLSYGLRQSIASYMSLVGDDRPSYPKNKKKDRRSQVITGATRRSVQLMSEEDYELELPSP
ncbi:src-like-adapter isoform X3 [Ambystoma mexicanum]|uniref:src-like-adapter isoform X3 n=1 Tax=Ambystoma mexicanum TaxID=8296 RepID=UPI0037E71716